MKNDHLPDQPGADALVRIAKVLGPNAPQDPTALLEQAADRMEKAARLMEQIQGLHQCATQQGFKGNSASQVMAFAQERLQEGSKVQAVAHLAKACESLDPELAFDEAHLGDSDQLLGACLRTIAVSAGRLTAQETTIVSLVGSLRAAPGGWAPDQEHEKAKSANSSAIPGP
jgi:hypothetical protein